MDEQAFKAQLDAVRAVAERSMVEERARSQRAMAEQERAFKAQLDAAERSMLEERARSQRAMAEQERAKCQIM
ncbi:hypothetical protein DPMN_000193 [Dreissena polymorpha]|uniref:Uncharacterized protein n=1 Tax=Dreissena polymorpha TaxID=45954 RepID=A0A9D4MGW8_DREPO|nr:hypothetical protein DPMN_000193 [Dreissena polymorpha]